MSKEGRFIVLGGIVSVVWNVPTIFNGFVVASNLFPMPLV